MRTNQEGWTATEFWENYMQLTVVENAFRVLESPLRLRPVWHHYAGRTEAHIFICVLAYALWITLAELARRAGLETLIRKPDVEHAEASPPTSADDPGGDPP
jgi:transposase